MGSCQLSLGKTDEAVKCHKKAVEIASAFTIDLLKIPHWAFFQHLREIPRNQHR